MKNMIKLILILIFLFILNTCSPFNAAVVFSNCSNNYGFTCYIDGVDKGYVSYFDDYRMEIPAGAHTLKATSSCGTFSAIVDIPASEEYWWYFGAGY